MKISMTRGDLKAVSFNVGADGQTITDPMDYIYFSVKKRYTDPDCLIQKKLSDGGIVFDGAGTYTITINPEDTERLPFGSYVCDIQVEKAPGIKYTFKGAFELEPEVTHRENEDGEDVQPGTRYEPASGKAF
jgi:hypothetical protein